MDLIKYFDLVGTVRVRVSLEAATEVSATAMGECMAQVMGMNIHCHTLEMVPVTGNTNWPKSL